MNQAAASAFNYGWDILDQLAAEDIAKVLPSLGQRRLAVR
jgi:hypothetical protein